MQDLGLKCILHSEALANAGNPVLSSTIIKMAKDSPGTSHRKSSKLETWRWNCKGLNWGLPIHSVSTQVTVLSRFFPFHEFCSWFIVKFFRVPVLFQPRPFPWLIMCSLGLEKLKPVGQIGDDLLLASTLHVPLATTQEILYYKLSWGVFVSHRKRFLK